ncbi:MAG: lytic transglycosylase, partial [Desulfovibrionaceae bacterium]|nr:lytic transglycosylase [Desulfovibrionaceae bacterium]
MSRRFAIIGLVAGLCASTVLLGLLAGFVPQHEGPEIRRRASNTVVVLRAEDFPAPIVASSEGGYRWSVRESAVPPGASVPPASAGSTALRENVVMFLEEGVSLLTAGHPKLVGSDVAADAFIPLLPLDGSPDHLFLVAAPPADYGETLDIGGRPVRWLAVQDAGIRRLDPECDLSHPVASLPSIREEQILPLPRMRAFNTGDTFTRARRYKELVERSARRFGLS